jgi:hypothetical protein
VVRELPTLDTGMMAALNAGVSEKCTERFPPPSKVRSGWPAGSTCMGSRTGIRSTLAIRLD